MASQTNSVPMAAHLSPPAYSKNYFIYDVWSKVYPQLHTPFQWPCRAHGKNHKEDNEWKCRPPKFLTQWQCCPGHPAVLKHPNPRHWPVTGTTPIPLPAPWFHSFTANPLQVTPRMGSSGTTQQRNAPLLHPNPLTSSGNDTHAAFKSPKQTTYISRLWLLRFFKLCPRLLPHNRSGLKERHSPHATWPTRGVGGEM